VARERVEHVVEEADARSDIALARPVQLDPNLDLRLPRLPRSTRFAWHPLGGGLVIGYRLSASLLVFPESKDAPDASDSIRAGRCGDSDSPRIAAFR
jgi:hypothetical protein